MFLAHEKKIPFTMKMFLVILFLNFGMLISGYLGETQVINKYLALIMGFIFFFIMFAYIWYVFVANGKYTTFFVWFTFYAYLAIWSTYGIVYIADEKTKNIVFNALDLLAKAIMGIFFWMVFTKSVSF